jgi:hypothetical protein
VVSSCWTDDNVNFKQDVYLSTTVNYKCNLPMKRHDIQHNDN